MDLSAFVTELARKIGYRGTAVPMSKDTSNIASARPSERHFDATGQWTGQYGTALAIVMPIEKQNLASFSGTIAYADGTKTKVEGEISSNQSHHDAVWMQIGRDVSDADIVAISFKETGYVGTRVSEVDLRGEYLGYASETAMNGVWVSNGHIYDEFVLRRNRR